MSIWNSLHVSSEIIQALDKAGFSDPTPIQKQVLPCAIKEGVDILGAAPTGSGKTLAFGIPLIMRVLELKHMEASNQTPETNENQDVSMTEPTEVDNVPEISNIPVFEITKPSKFNSKKLKKHSDLYNFLDVVEELDIDTGEVRAIHSLGDCQSPERITSDNDDADKPPNEDPPRKVGESKLKSKNRIYGLVLLPTRELAVQVCKHLRMLAEFCQPQIRIETILGGMSVQKQTRILQHCPDIVVATPGRLWHFIQDEEPHISTLRHANVLVVDEADRLVEANHFEDLRALFHWLQSDPQSQQIPVTDPEQLPDVPKQDPKKSRKRKRRAKLEQINLSRQTLVFSATLTFVHQGAMRPGSGAKQRKKMIKPKGNMTTKLKLSMLRELLGLRPNARIIDLTLTRTEAHTIQPTSSDPIDGDSSENQQPKDHKSAISTSTVCTPNGLQEFRLLCPDQASKDVRLFWFLSFGRHEASVESGGTNQRCLIFLNSKAGVRRLAGVMRQLASSTAFRVSQFSGPQSVSVLHADMMQKQRLRALERFQADPNGVLLASDVAARGLDLATMDNCGSGGVPWVVHFEVPHTAELYIHRRGRTARAHRTGMSLLFICPSEAHNWHRLAVSLRRPEPDLDDFTISPTDRHLSVCDRIVYLARQLDLLEHTSSRESANESWLKRAAKEADILLETDSERDDDDYDIPKSKKSKLGTSGPTKNDQQIRDLKFQLNQLIDKSRVDLMKYSSTKASVVKTKLHSWSKKRLLKKMKV